jgi:hypothetical protein
MNQFGVAGWFILKTENPKILEDLRLENVDIFYGHLEYVSDIWDILRPFGIACVHLVQFFQFGYLVIGLVNKSGNPE